MLSFHPSDAKLAPIYSNRSASFLKLSKVTQALTDAEKCVELKPDWDKAHFRKAAALEASEKDAEALIALEVREKTQGLDSRDTNFVAIAHRASPHAPLTTASPNA